MGIKDVFNQAPTPKEETLYKQVLDEMESGVMRKGIYAKALADGLGDEGKAHSLYIKYRVQSLIDEEKHKAEPQEQYKAEPPSLKLSEETIQKNNIDDFNNPVWHIHKGNPPKFKSEISFNSLMNLVSICNSTDKNVIWGFVVIPREFKLNKILFY